MEGGLIGNGTQNLNMFAFNMESTGLLLLDGSSTFIWIIGDIFDITGFQELFLMFIQKNILDLDSRQLLSQLIS